LKKKLEQTKTQFAVDRYVSRNEAHVVADKAKLDYMLALNFPSVLTTPPPDTSLITPPLASLITPPFDTSQTPEHQIYQKQDDYSESFASFEKGLSSDISDDLDDFGDLSNSNESNDHDNDEDEFGVKDKDLFKHRFEALDNSRKWKLKSGRFVEDVLYELGMRCRYHNLVHSFIIDTEDTFIKNEFSKEELSEIVEKKQEQSIPEIDEEILEYINNTFAKKSTKEIREVLNTTHPLLGRNYDQL